MEGDNGLVVKNAAAHHAISAKFPKKIDPKGKTLVVQYEVKLQGQRLHPSSLPSGFPPKYFLRMLTCLLPLYRWP